VLHIQSSTAAHTDHDHQQYINHNNITLNDGTTRQHCPKIIKPLQSLPLQMAERLFPAQPDSVASHVTAHSITDYVL